MSDEVKVKQFVALARLGDEEAYVSLYNLYLPVVLRLEKVYYLHDFDHDDWLQEGRVALMKAIRKYDDKKGVTFGLFFKMIAENQICSLLRKQEAKKRRVLQETQPLESQNLDYVSNQFVAVPQYDEQLYIRERLAQEVIFFSRLEKLILQEYFVEQRTLSEIEERHDLTQRSVRSAYDRIRKKFRQHIS